MQRVLTSLSFFGYLVLAACAKPAAPSAPDSFAIIGGTPVSAGSAVAQHVVAIRASDGRSTYLCTGVLVASDIVLTAAHCGADLQSGEILFSTDLSTVSSANARPIAQVEVQPSFGETLNRMEGRGRSASRLKNWGDLALLHFSGGLANGYSKVKIGDGETLTDGQNLILAGYGLTNGRSETPANVLNQVEVSVRNARYSRSEFSMDQTEGRGACHGDSGGPAFAEVNGGLQLMGITSRGNDKVCEKASIYTRVSSFADWLGGDR